VGRDPLAARSEVRMRRRPVEDAGRR
jgi:hypothetical protein